MIKFYLIIFLGLLQPLLAETATLTGNAGNRSAVATVNVIIDTDRDGLLDIQEDVNSNGIVDAGETDFRKTDTDGDGIHDMQDITPLVNQFTANPDGAGLINLGNNVNLANGLCAVWGFESIVSNKFLDTSGNAKDATITGAVNLGAAGSGMVSRAASFGPTGGYLKVSPTVAANKTSVTVAFWYKASQNANYGALAPLFSVEKPGGSLVTLYHIYQVQGYDTLVWATGTPSAFTGAALHVPLIKPGLNSLEDGNWHHVVLVADQTAVRVRIDGVSNHQNVAVGFSGLSGTANGHFYIGAFSSAFSPITYPQFRTKAELDQFVVYDRALTTNEQLALYNYDADGDGSSNSQELTNGTDPFKYDNDADRDGLTNIEEAEGKAFFNGVQKIFGITQKDNFDSDGDLFDDYWEAKYFFTPAGSSTPNVNPNSANWPVNDNPATPNVIEGDYDSDGLSNYQELVNGADPNKADTDNDGINDKDEADYGSSATDSADKPLRPQDFYGDENLGSYWPIGNLGTIVKAGGEEAPVVYAQVGDPSGSNSERWRLLLDKKQVVAQTFGELSELTRVALDPTDYHEIRLQHVGTDPIYLQTNPGPDYDYWAAVRPGPKSPFILCDPEGLLKDPLSIPEDTFFNDVDPDQIREKTAYLIPLDNYSWSTSYSGGDAVGPRYRKVALNGRPIADEKPQQEAESDLPEEETYVDAFNLGLHHDTTFAYTPLGASDLVLQASASVEETGFSDRSGLRPNERFDQPFGVGWTSNLCSYIEVVENIGAESDDPVALNVVDEAGHPQRFGTRNFQQFFPWPSSRTDKKTYLNTLTRNGTNFTLQKKFGNTLTYTKCKTWLMYGGDRIEGSTTMRRHTYWRLSEVQDRYGVRLKYDYDTVPGVPNDVSLIPRQISSPDREGQWLVIKRSTDYRRVESITDSRGSITKFNYLETPLAYKLANGNTGDSVASPRLASVSYPDQTTVSYDYDGGLEVETDTTDPQNTRTTWHYHANLKSATDKRGNTHTFHYGFDTSKQYWDSSVNGTRCLIDLERLPVAVQAEVAEQLAERNAEGHGLWKTMFGMPRKISSVDLPAAAGSTGFVSQGEMRFGETVSFTTSPRTTVTDAAGNQTVYDFTGMLAEVVDVDSTAKSISKEWMVYYLSSSIHHGGLPAAPGHIGTETYQFDPTSGLSLWRATDLSGNVTTWEFGDACAAMPTGLAQGSLTMTKWADPTAKIDALGRRETYTYSGSYRVMDGIDDPYHTTSAFLVDGIGRRKTKSILQGGVTSLSQERYDYNNLRFKAFQTGKATLATNSVSGQAWETDLKTSYLPDTHGRLWREITDPDGEKLTIEHSYDFNNNRTATLDARGNRTRFSYDKLNRLIETTYPSAGTRNGEAVTTKQFWYNLNGSKAAEIDEEGRYTIHHYDALNRRTTTIRDMDGQGLPERNADGLVTDATKGSVTGNDLVTHMIYNSVGSVTHQIDPRGTVTRTFYDAIQRPIHVFTGLTEAEANGDLAGCTTAAGASSEKTHTEFRYTDGGLTFPRGGALKGNPGGNAFDSSGFKPTEAIRYAAVRGAGGTFDQHTYAAYDGLYRPVRTETEYEPGVYAKSTTAYGTIAAEKEALLTTTTDDLGKVTSTLLDGMQRPVSVTDAFGTTLAATTQSIYSSTGLVWKTIDPMGRESETEYDKSGRPVAVWQPDPVTKLVNRATPNDPLLGSPRTQTAYDKNSNVTVSINPLGFRWETEYDARNRKIVEIQPTVTQTEIISDQAAETPFKNPVIRSSYDGVGNVIAVTNARGHITRTFHDYAYRVTDFLSNPVTGIPSTNPANPAANDILVHNVLDANGNALSVTDGNGNATRNTYDRLNRLATTATNPVNGQPSANPATPAANDITVRNQYDDSNNLVQVTDGEGHITGFRYDGLARKTRTIWDEGSGTMERTEQASYDGLVQLTRIDPKLQQTTYQYDALHRLENVLYQTATTDKRHLTYDLVGNIRTVTYPNETAARKILRGVEQTFDHLNLLTSETSAGATHQYTYDKAGNRRTTVYAATGRTLVSTYDKLNRLLTLGEGSAGVPPASFTSYGYDLAGNTVKKKLPNGSVTLSLYDALNRKLSETTRKAAGGLISSFDYSTATSGYPNSYDKVGNLLKIVETYGRADIKARTVTNTYDRTYRLSTETLVEGSAGVPPASTTATTYGYDKANNRTSKIVAGGSTPGTWISVYGTSTDGYNSNQLKTVTKGATVTSFQYDQNGNRTFKKLNGANTQTYLYDHENRLTTLTDTTKGTFAYAYDHRTRRVGRNEQGGTGVPPASAEISFSGGLSVQEYTSGSGTPNVETIRGSDYGGGIGGVLYTIRTNQRSYNAYNSRGDVVSKTDDASIITWQSSYEAFGIRTQEQGTTADRQKANTKDEDPTGLLNEGMRYRDLEFGIFLTRDPAGFVDGPNVYTYVRQNPWTAFDSDGLFMQIVGNWLGERWQAPQVVQSMAEHTGTVVGATQATLGVASMVPVLGKVADGLSAGISASEGNYGEAAMTAGGGKAAQLATKAVKATAATLLAAKIASHMDETADVMKIAGNSADEVADVGKTARNVTEESAEVARGPGGAGSVQAGQAGEAVSGQLTGMPKNTVRIPSASGKKAYRVPDHMDDAQRHITETKNVKYQHYSSQLKDDKAHVLRGGGPGRVDVLIDKRTTISRQLVREHLNPGSPVKLRSANLND